MKKLIIAIIFMFTYITPSCADFTIADLFISGGVNKPVDTKIKEHDCQ